VPRVSARFDEKAGYVGELIAQSPLERAIAAALAGLSPQTRRVYASRIAQWVAWSNGQPQLDRETVKKYIRSMELRGCSAQVQNQALAALKKLASEAAELEWLLDGAAVQIGNIKSKKITGIRTGRWLDAAQCRRLLAQLPDSPIGKRDGAVIALLLGCGLRRAEACSLTTEQIQLIHGRTIIVNLIGKGNRVRSVAVPTWSAQLLEKWRVINGEGQFLRSFYGDGKINGSLSETAVREIVQKYGKLIGIPDLNPHDLRRTFARLSREGGAPLETIQHSLGHASLKTTELYTRTGEECNAGDFIQL